ncbi:MAG TPA: Hpt domain-containing protein [Fibrobacteria bacterium]|nr:Hpt domain-containing protein [Fibrobacteria bacterium]HOX52634.1 Hpt domain-containing protein [Fibrobacteria bacterium]
MDSSELLDVSVLDSLRKYGQMTFVSKMVDLFLDTSLESIESIEVASRAERWQEAGFTAHALGSSCGSLGLKKLHGVVHAIDAASRAKRFHEIPGLEGQLRPLWELSCQALREHRASMQ